MIMGMKDALTLDEIEGGAEWLGRVGDDFKAAAELPLGLTVPDIEDAFDDLFGPGGGDDGVPF